MAPYDRIAMGMPLRNTPDDSGIWPLVFSAMKIEPSALRTDGAVKPPWFSNGGSVEEDSQPVGVGHPARTSSTGSPAGVVNQTLPGPPGLVGPPINVKDSSGVVTW